jgi:hypothetical protein
MKMSNIKGKGQRLIPEELLKYLEVYKENHPDPTQGGGATLDDIVDSQGNKRFIEGEGTTETISGVTFTYNKWSLSGTHLMLVCAGETTSGTALSSNMLFITYSLPDFIMNKIYPIWMNNSVDIKPFYIRNVNSESASLTNIQLRKENNTLTMYSSLAETLSGKRAFRFQFDLLIDDTYE